MTSRHAGTPTRSPLLGRDEAEAYGPLPAPAPHTGAELQSLLRLLTAPGMRIGPVTVGHSRDSASQEAARVFTRAWELAGRPIADVVEWPEEAASWLRPARRFTAGRPDAWVVAAAPLGWAQMGRRLRHSTDWVPSRTFGFASLADPRLPALAGARTLDGLRGAAADGGDWIVDHGWVTYRAPDGA